MDLETAVSVAFLIFALAFFMFAMWFIGIHSPRENYDRLAREAHEFGYDGSRLHAEAEAKRPRRK